MEMNMFKLNFAGLEPRFRGASVYKHTLYYSNATLLTFGRHLIATAQQSCSEVYVDNKRC